MKYICKYRMYNANAEEKKIIKYWGQDKTFEKSVISRPENKPYVFYDGPPFATGLPHYGHLAVSTMKDIVARFWTMRGFCVERKWGWDCHGLPIENLIEQELNLTTKKDIEEYGVAKFNEACRATVLKYAHEWEKTIERMGRWVDMNNDYKTMDPSFMESVWWVFKQLWDRDLIYKDYKAMHICPRCVTTLSNFEVTQGYKDVKDISVTVKFKLKEGNTTKELFVGVQGPFYALAWTTTPWTLPGNVLLAVGPDIEYRLIEVEAEEGVFLVARDRIEAVLKDKKYKEVGRYKGSQLTGLEYEPLFPYFADTPKAFRVVTADFVSTQDGTGVVHIAPAFGEDDFKIGKAEGLPLVQHVTMEGKFVTAVTDFAHMDVKPKDDPTKADVEIIKWLAHNGKLFAKQKIEHSYPHCWRCDTPLLNYATTSWFVRVAELKDQLLKNNESINWVPEHIKYGRFGKWLEGARDWAISRSRYWGTPLPVWESEDGEVLCVGSIDELRTVSNEKITKLIFVRHGESEKNILDVKSRALDKYPLTSKGKNEVKALAKTIIDQVDVIVSSPVLRTKQTAEILSKELGVEVVFDELVSEYNSGEWDELDRESLMERSDYKAYKAINSASEKFHYHRGVNGETREEIVERVRKFVDKISKAYAGKTVMLVSHGGINAALGMALYNYSHERYLAEESITHDVVQTFYIKENGKPVDLHKHLVDPIIITKDGKTYKRIPEVLDCWFESGSMPYGQMHYPFENKDKFEASFPAEFIAEAQDQTRGWFYTLHVLAAALSGGKNPAIPSCKRSVPAFKNVIVNGIVLAEDGKKMSKRLKNYPEPDSIMEKYGADAMRFYLASSPVMEAESLNFSEAGVREVFNKVINTAANVLEFYAMFANDEVERAKTMSQHILDRWVLAKLQQLVKETTEQVEGYRLAFAARAISEFITELSQWYVRRSRERFKGETGGADKKAAVATLREVLLTLSKIMAPYTPFIAEKIYQTVHNFPLPEGEYKGESVHLQDWPKVNTAYLDAEVLDSMLAVRQIVEQGLAARAKAGIKVRQPLMELRYAGPVFESTHDQEQYRAIIKDELNVKHVIQARERMEIEKLAANENYIVVEHPRVQVALNKVITEELKKEGLVREIVRGINQLRKEQGLTIHDAVVVRYAADNSQLLSVFADFADQIKKAVLATDLQAVERAEHALDIDGMTVHVALKKTEPFDKLM